MVDSKPFWALVGVILGFLLNEFSSIIKKRVQIRNLKRTLREECKSIIAQIPQLTDVLNKCINSLKNQRILPGPTVRSISTVYRSTIVELTPYLSEKERNLLHVVYERLRVADDLLENYYSNLTRELKEKVIENPFNSWIVRITELITSYNVVIDLLKSYLEDKPIDVFLTEFTENERQQILFK